MPDMDSPQIAGILEQGSPTGGVVMGLHLSKRPREEGSPLPGKRGRGENGDISLTLQIPVPAAPAAAAAAAAAAPPGPPAAVVVAPATGGGCSLLQPPPPLCESPSKLNQAAQNSSSTSSSSSSSSSSGSSSSTSASSSHGFAPFSGGGSAPKPSYAVTSAHPLPGCPVAAAAAAASRRKARAPAAAAAAFAAPPSLGATDPIFHAALLRLAHRRSGGDTCAEDSAFGWHWRSTPPGRFDHWPRALHPALMDLLACVTAGEEQVLLTGCDVKGGGCGQDENPTTKMSATRMLHPPPPPPAREDAWPAPPRPRTPARQGPAVPAAPQAGTPLPPSSSLVSTPVAPPGSARSCCAQTPPLSALRRPGSSRRSSNRVRFSTHDMSVVDTPDPTRGGSEEGMLSALGGLESILAAAERVRKLAASDTTAASASASAAAAAAAATTAAGSLGESEVRRNRHDGRHFEGYFDRFSSAAGGEVANDPAGEAEAALVGGGSSPGGKEKEQPVEPEGQGRCGAVAVARTPEPRRSLRGDASAFVGVLDEIASSDSAPVELSLAGGWGPEHSSAAAFYAKELALLCGGAGDGAEVAPGGAASGSHLRVRYLDVLSCLVRYNLKLLLNMCVCDTGEVDNAMQEESPEALLEAPESGDDSGSGEEEQHASNAGETPPPASALTVVVPGRADAASLPIEQGMFDAAWGSSAQAQRGCGCVTVLDGTGALEFNTEDVAALLTIALGRVHPFMPLAARLAVMSEENTGFEEEEEDDEDSGGAISAKVWPAILEFTSESRRATAAAAAAASAMPNVGASPTDLFAAAGGAGPTGETESSVGVESSPPARAADPPRKEGVSPEASGGEAAGVVGAGAPTTPAGSSTADGGEGAEAPLELTVDEAADLLEYVAAARFIAQLMAEPVVAAGVAAGRWAYAERLAEQVRKLAGEEEAAAAATAAASGCSGGGEVPAAAPSLSGMLCLGALADVQGLGVTMAQQARYAPVLESVLKGELRRALRRGQGSKKRRIRNRLQQGAPYVFSFPMVTPCCCFVPVGGAA